MKDNTILVIEDDEINRSLIRSVLELGKCLVLESENAENGIQLAREHHPNLIIMDIRLPEMDGLEATRFIKEDSNLKDIPIVAITGYNNKEDEDMAINTGCVAYLRKPIDVRNFRKTIAMILAVYCPGCFK